MGARGLLGSAVLRQAPGALVVRVRWGTPDAAADLRAGLASLVSSTTDEPWRILWCAGSGTTSTTPTHIDEELATFRSLLAAISALSPDQRSAGLVTYASSAGGVYGGAGDGPFDETSPAVPLGAYGKSKLAAEDSLRAFSEESGVRVLICRIANLYGPGQDLAKPQGLISRLAVSVVSRAPLSIFVPLDTLRDYLYVDDAARLLLAASDRAGATEARVHLKVLCSGRAVSIAAVLAEVRRVSGSRPPVVTGVSAEAALQARDLRLHSTVWDDLDSHASTTLASGIGKSVADVRRVWLDGGLAPERR